MRAQQGLDPQQMTGYKSASASNASIFPSYTRPIGHSRSSSMQSSASDNSSPITPTFSTRHSRYPSSNSSLSSTPPASERGDTLSSSRKGPPADKALSDVVEEPFEREADIDSFHSFSGLFQNQAESDPCLLRSDSFTPSIAPDYDLSDGVLGRIDLGSSHVTKRRKAGTSPFNGIATRIGSRFPSLTQRWKDRKTSSSAAFDADLGVLSQTSSNSASPTGVHSSFFEYDDLQMPALESAMLEEGMDLMCDPALDNVQTLTVEEPIDRKALASTPLLPPVMTEIEAEEHTIQSPLQSPTIADPSRPFSTGPSPLATPHLSAVNTPPLSTQPSLASFHQMKLGHVMPSSEITPLALADADDEWVVKLGHANYQIDPAPYMPMVCDKDACERMRADYTRAQCNYIKHVVRTSEHYGATSKVYKLTEEKWLQIDAEWKKNSDMVAALAGEPASPQMVRLSGEGRVLAKVPSLNNPKSGGKFPKLGDEDIVGPMVQMASQIQRRPSRKARLLKLITDCKPRSSAGLSSTFGRSR